MNGAKKPTSPSALAAPGGAVPAALTTSPVPAAGALKHTPEQLQQAVDAAFASLEAHRAEYDAADNAVLRARAALVLAEAVRERARLTFWEHNDALNESLGVQLRAAGGAR